MSCVVDRGMKAGSFGSRTAGRRVLVAATLGSLMLTAGCDNALQGGASGAALGALGGMGIGAMSGNMGEGAAIGAILGGLSGLFIGDQNDRRSRHCD